MFASIGKRLTLLVGTAVAMGFVVVVTFYAFQYERNILRQNERTVQQLTESVIQGLEAVMLTGHADVAESYASRLKRVDGVTDFRIMRISGLEAFLDNETIYKVNEVRGDEDFLPRKTESKIVALAADNPNLTDVVRSKGIRSYYGQEGGKSSLTFLWPILNGKDCTKCHGKDHEVRGVLKFTTSMAAVEDEVARLRLNSGVIMMVALVMVVVMMSLLLRRAVVRPIQQVSAAMGLVSGGDLQHEVPVLGRDELAQMARSFNAMLLELRDTYQGYRTEHDKLETIILGSRDGIVVTNSAANVVLVNPAAEQLLGKSSKKITEDGLLALVDEPARIQHLLSDSAIHADVMLYQNRFLALSVAEIRAEDGRLIGQTALIRDMTAEKRMEQMLRALSNTDGLTGLANRRMMDESLKLEIGRALRSGRPMAILMFDVDYFKRFNDQHGHAQGDEVLKAVADVVQRCARNVDLPCRFGGEEFLTILNETSLEGAMIVAERTRASVEALSVDGLRVTISVGVAGLLETGATTSEALIELADKALYAAKNGGRNRVCAAGRAP